MTRNLKKLFEQLREERLDARERDNMRQGLLKMVRNSVAERHIEQESEGPKFSFLSLMTRRLISMPAIIIAIIVVLSGGVSVAARSALPGDVLYPVKLEINENLKTAFAFSEEAKANAETSIAAERLEEAEQLAARGELGTDVATKLSQRFEARAENLNDIIDRLEADGKTEAAANLTAALETTLSVHNQILRRLKEREVQPKVEVRAEKDRKSVV